MPTSRDIESSSRRRNATRDVDDLRARVDALETECLALRVWGRGLRAALEALSARVRARDVEGLVIGIGIDITRRLQQEIQRLPPSLRTPVAHRISQMEIEECPPSTPTPSGPASSNEPDATL